MGTKIRVFAPKFSFKIRKVLDGALMLVAEKVDALGSRGLQLDAYSIIGSGFYKQNKCSHTRCKSLSSIV